MKSFFSNQTFKKTIAFVFFLLFFELSFAQTGIPPREKLSQTVRGIVTDVDSKLPLIGVSVVILDSNPTIATATDAKGVFRFENIPIGRITIQFSYVGYESRTVSNIVVNSGKEVVLDINMQESTVNIAEVVVKSSRKGEVTNVMSRIGAHTISVEETKRYTGGMDDPARVVSSIAGVASTPDGSSDIIVRGNSPKYLQWRLDGIEISSPYHMDDQNASVGALTALNNSLLATSDFYTGAFSAEFGNVLSTVMDVKLRKGNNEKFESACGVGLMGTDVTFEGPFKKGYAGSYLINYRYSTISLLTTLGLIDVQGALNYQDATFNVFLPTKKMGTFSFFGLGGLSGFKIKNSNQVPVTGIKDAALMKDYDKANFLSNFGMNHVLTINSNSFIKTSLSYSATGMDDDLSQGYKIRLYDNMGEFLRDSTTNKIQAYKSRITNSVYRSSIIYNSRLNAKNKIQIGIKYTLSVNKYDQNTFDDQTASMINITDFNKNVNMLNNFISWKHSFNDHISVIAGLHNVNVFLNKKSTLEPRLAVNWKIDNTNSIYVGYGKHSTMESVHNYYTKIKLADGSIIEPNKNLDLLKADHYVMGYEKRFTENLMAKFEVYYQHLYNLPVENNDTSYYATINEGTDYRYVALVNKGVGKNYGMELTIERFFDNNYYFLINGSLFDSKYKSLEGVWRNTQYNGNYLVNILCGKEFKNIGKNKNKTLAINSKVFFGGGKKYIPLLRDAQGNIAVDPANNRYFDYKKAYDNKLDNFFQLNLSVSYKINKHNVTHEIFLDLMNLTNNQARIYEYYDASEPSKVGYVKQLQFFPNLMYRVYF
ncbi:MAG: TonB-dependent receptor [Bacteroidales bacterium]|nr:TonB-dependent receptor [Bacteroidales bacterium]